MLLCIVSLYFVTLRYTICILIHSHKTNSVRERWVVGNPSVPLLLAVHFRAITLYAISGCFVNDSQWHDDVIKLKHFPHYWPFMREIHRSPVNSPHKGQWRRALKLSLICTLIKRLSKQSRGWWFETPSRSLWRHCNGFIHNFPEWNAFNDGLLTCFIPELSSGYYSVFNIAKPLSKPMMGYCQ